MKKISKRVRVRLTEDCDEISSGIVLLQDGSDALILVLPINKRHECNCLCICKKSYNDNYDYIESDKSWINVEQPIQHKKMANILLEYYNNK